MSEIVWEAPPNLSVERAAARARALQPIADGLRAKPGEWGRVATLAGHRGAALATYIKKGSGPFGPAGAFEAKSRSVPWDGHSRRESHVYARYVGPGGQP